MKTLTTGDLKWIDVEHGGHVYSAAPCCVHFGGIPLDAIAVKRDDGSRDRWISTVEDCIRKLETWRLPTPDARELVKEAHARRES